MSPATSIIPSLDKSNSLSPNTRLQMEGLVIPSMSEEAAFALMDEFYGPTPPQSTLADPECGDADVADVMEGLDETEESTQLLDGDLLMPDASPPLHQQSSSFPAAFTTLPESLRDEQAQPSSTPDLPMLDASPIPHSARKNPFVSVCARTSPDFAVTVQAAPEGQRERNPNSPELPMADTSPAESSPECVDEQPSATSPALPFALKMAPKGDPKTPTSLLTGPLIGSVRASSLAPSTGGHRSSMQSEMRQEEAELASEELEELPPFPGFRASGEDQTRKEVGLLRAEGHRRESYDLSSSRDIGDITRKQAMVFLKPSPKQSASPNTTSESTATGPLGLAMRRDSAHIPSPLPGDLTPVDAAAIRKRHVPWDPTSEPSQILAQKNVESPEPTRIISEPSQLTTAEKTNKAVKFKRISDSDSSLTDLSLSGLISSSPVHPNKQLPLPTDQPSRSDKQQQQQKQQQRKDSSVTPPNGSKPAAAAAPSSAAKDEAFAKQQPAQPKATPKRKRNTPASSASPGSTRPAKIAKPSAAKNKKSAPVGNDLKGIIGAGILDDVLKNKGPRLTRRQQKAIEDSRPNAASVARRRHTGHVDYKE